jgi:hypothetical protein
VSISLAPRGHRRAGLSRRVCAALHALKRSAPRTDHFALHERPDAAQQTVSSESLDSLM